MPGAITDGELRGAIARAFQASGFRLERAASRVLIAKLREHGEELLARAREDPGALNAALRTITDALLTTQQHLLKEPVVSAGIMARVLEGLEAEEAAAQDREMGGEDVNEEDVYMARYSMAELYRKARSSVAVVPAFDVPSYRFHVDRKDFVKLRKRQLHAAPQAKLELYRERYQVLLQRCLRNPMFAKGTMGVTQQAQSFKLTTIDTLLGSASKDDADDADGTEEEALVILGMLAELQEGKYFLEDLDASVRIDMSQADCCSGLFTESCFVIAEGTYTDGVFRCNTLGFPPPEPRRATLKCFPNIDFLGAGSQANDEEVITIAEERGEDAMFVVLSDVWLDRPEVVAKLRVLFDGYSMLETPPIAFILMGNFSSESYGAGQLAAAKDAFDALADMIVEYELSDSHFIFVPGPRDPGLGQILPRSRIPDVLTEKVRQRVRNAVFTSNPCRIRYCTQELVVFREDILCRMRRNCVLAPSGDDINAHLVKTLLDQGHLCPLPLHVRPIYWEHDQALRLYPLPDLLVLADRCEPYNLTYEGCTTFNPGAFAVNNFSFMVYWPSKARLDPAASDSAREQYEGRVEFSRIE